MLEEMRLISALQASTNTAVGPMALLKEVLTMDCTFIQTRHPSMYLLLVTNLTATRNWKCYELDIQYNVN